MPWAEVGVHSALVCCQLLWKQCFIWICLFCLFSALWIWMTVFICENAWSVLDLVCFVALQAQCRLRICRLGVSGPSKLDRRQWLGLSSCFIHGLDCTGVSLMSASLFVVNVVALDVLLILLLSMCYWFNCNGLIGCVNCHWTCEQRTNMPCCLLRWIVVSEAMSSVHTPGRCSGGRPRCWSLVWKGLL